MVRRRPTLVWGAAVAAVVALGSCSASISTAPSGQRHASTSSPAANATALPTEAVPSESPEGNLQTEVFHGAPGSSTYQCVHVDEHVDTDESKAVDLQSGGFVAGNFRASKQDFAATYDDPSDHTGVKVYWIPLHAGQMESLTVVATRVSGQKITRTMHQPTFARGGGNLFYPSGVPIPKPGTWKLVATAGPDKGCFIVSFHASTKEG